MNRVKYKRVRVENFSHHSLHGLNAGNAVWWKECMWLPARLPLFYIFIFFFGCLYLTPKNNINNTSNDMRVSGRMCHEYFVNVAGQSVHNAGENKYRFLFLLLFSFIRTRNEEEKTTTTLHTQHINGSTNVFSCC